MHGSKSGNKITLGGTIKSVNKDALEFEVSQHDDTILEKTYTVKLSGTWQADEYNCLAFAVKKEYFR